MKAHRENLLKPASTSFFYKYYEVPNLEIGWHYHPEYEISAIIRGRGLRFIGDAITPYSGSDLVMLGPNLQHNWESYNENGQQINCDHQFAFIQFDRNFLGETFFDKPELSNIYHLLESTQRGLSFPVSTQEKAIELMLQMKTLSGLKQLQALLSLLELLAHAKNAQPIASTFYSDSRYRKQEVPIDKVISFIHSHYSESICIDDLAKHAHMSTRNLIRLMRQSTGKTVVEYINDLRIGNACFLLQNSKLSITEICYQVGYNNLSLFNRQFNKLKNMAPSKYRTSYQQK